MDCDGPEVAVSGNQAEMTKQEVLWQRETAATVELPDVEVPLDLPQV